MVTKANSRTRSSRGMLGTAMNAWKPIERDARWSRWWLPISILLHLPFSPLGPLIGLLALIGGPHEAAGPLESLQGIPVELLSAAAPEKEVAAAEETAVEPLPPPDVPAVTMKPKPKKKVAMEQDAGSPVDAGPDLDAGLSDKNIAEKSPADAGELVAGADVGGTQHDDDALAAATQGMADTHANVRLSLYMEKIRLHPLASQLSDLLKSVYQWRDFFTPASLDPVRDFDRIFVVGPQFRDSSQVAAFLQHRVKQTTMQHAIDGIVKKSGNDGAWVRRGKSPAARAKADRSERLFVMYPGHVVAVVPPSVEKQALAIPDVKLPNAKADETARIVMKEPWRALLGTRFQIAKSIKTAEIQVFAEDDGGVRISAKLDDESPQMAERDAKQLKRDVDTVTLANNWLLSGSRLAEPIQVRTDGATVWATLHVTRAQAERILRIAQAYLTPEGREETRRRPVPQPSDAGAAALPLPPVQIN